MEEIVIERKKIVKYNPKNYLKDLLKNELQHYLCTFTKELSWNN